MTADNILYKFFKFNRILRRGSKLGNTFWIASNF